MRGETLEHDERLMDSRMANANFNLTKAAMIGNLLELALLTAYSEGCVRSYYLHWRFF
jgi:hypothetical protein